MANDAERAAFADAVARGEALIRAMGGDPKKPTVQQAEAAAMALLEPLKMRFRGKSAGEVDAFVASAAELLDQIERETH